MQAYEVELLAVQLPLFKHSDALLQISATGQSFYNFMLLKYYPETNNSSRRNYKFNTIQFNTS